MGVRSKQLNLPELFEVLDPRYGKAGAIKEVTIGKDWTLEGSYFVQTIENIEGLTVDSKLVVQVKKSIEDTYEENLKKENLFAHIVKIVSGENSLTIYSCSELDTSFDIQVLYFN